MDEERPSLQAWGIANRALRSAINKRATELAGTGTWFGAKARDWLALAAVGEAAARRQAVADCVPELIEFVRTCPPERLLVIGRNAVGRVVADA